MGLPPEFYDRMRNLDDKTTGHIDLGSEWCARSGRIAGSPQFSSRPDIIDTDQEPIQVDKQKSDI